MDRCAALSITLPLFFSCTVFVFRINRVGVEYKECFYCTLLVWQGPTTAQITTWPIAYRTPLESFRNSTGMHNTGFRNGRTFECLMVHLHTCWRRWCAKTQGCGLIFSLFRPCEETDGHVVQRLSPKTERSLTYTLQALPQTARWFSTSCTILQNKMYPSYDRLWHMLKYVISRFSTANSPTESLWYFNIFPSLHSSCEHFRGQ